MKNEKNNNNSKIIWFAIKIMFSFLQLSCFHWYFCLHFYFLPTHTLVLHLWFQILQRKPKHEEREKIKVKRKYTKKTKYTCQIDAKYQGKFHILQRDSKSSLRTTIFYEWLASHSTENSPHVPMMISLLLLWTIDLFAMVDLKLCLVIGVCVCVGVESEGDYRSQAELWSCFILFLNALWF